MLSRASHCYSASSGIDLPVLWEFGYQIINIDSSYRCSAVEAFLQNGSRCLWRHLANLNLYSTFEVEHNFLIY